MTKLVYIEIANEPVIPATTSTFDGQTRQVPAKQNAYAHTGKAHPLPFTVKVPDSGPYRPGNYLIAGDVFRAGQYGLDFRAGNLELVPAELGLSELTGKPGLKAAS